MVVSEGWQTQVFLFRRTFGKGEESRRPDLSEASVLMGRTGSGFYPDRDDERWTELARLALAGNRKAMPSRDDLREMLVHKFEDPMLGIYAAHLLLREPEIRVDLLEIVLGNLFSMLGEHPDVQALRLKLDELRGRELSVEVPSRSV